MTRLAAAVALAACVAGCGIKELPPDKTFYAGDWVAQDEQLSISPNGHVDYWKQKGGVTTKVNAPIQKFIGDDFKCGFLGLGTTFHVTQPPRHSALGWTMIVDGVELHR